MKERDIQKKKTTKFEKVWGGGGAPGGAERVLGKQDR